MLRYGVAMCAVFLGGITAAADIAVSLPLLPPQQRGVPVRPFSEEDRLVFDACITFYGVVYATGQRLYRWRGAQPEAEELRRWSRWHKAILNLAGGCWLIASGWPTLQVAVVRPSLVVGAILIVLATWDAWRGCRNPRREPLRQI